MIVIVFLSCNDQDTNELNGCFTAIDGKPHAFLDIYNSRRYEVLIYQETGWHLKTNISKGSYKVVEKIVYLKENWTWKKFSATIIDENRLVSISLPNYNKGDTLFCFVKYHPNGKRSMDLSWKNSKKDGLWQYWDEKGNFVCDTCFKEGVPSQDTMYCEPDTNQGLIL